MGASDYNEPSGVRLMKLITTRLPEILRKEEQNSDKICLYSIGTFWTAFERSAYQLSLRYPNLTMFTINHPKLEIPAVAISISPKQLNINSIASDDIVLAADTINKFDFKSWHSSAVEKFKN